MNNVNQPKTGRFEKMPVAYLAAGIDVGSRSHFVAIGQNKEDVKEFGVYTEDLNWVMQTPGCTELHYCSPGGYSQLLAALTTGP